MFPKKLLLISNFVAHQNTNTVLHIFLTFIRVVGWHLRIACLSKQAYGVPPPPTLKKSFSLGSPGNLVYTPICIIWINWIAPCNGCVKCSNENAVYFCSTDSSWLKLVNVLTPLGIL